MLPDASSQTFAALADPTRRAILKRLAACPANVKELSRPFDLSGPAVRKHLRVLERAGLVRRPREAQSRACELDAEPLKAVAACDRRVPRFLGRELRSARVRI
jgi:DNA-binding transcriptional ArsR family regulator